MNLEQITTLLNAGFTKQEIMALQPQAPTVQTVQAPTVQAPTVQAPTVQAPTVQAPTVQAPAQGGVQTPSFTPAQAYDNWLPSLLSLAFTAGKNQAPAQTVQAPAPAAIAGDNSFLQLIQSMNQAGMTFDIPPARSGEQILQERLNSLTAVSTPGTNQKGDK